MSIHANEQLVEGASHQQVDLDPYVLGSKLPMVRCGKG